MTSAGRFVVLGTATPRRPWFRDVATWATGGMVPIEFVACLSLDEVRARLDGGRAYSALLVDELVTDIDRDLVDVAHRAGCAVIVVGRDPERWRRLGAQAVLPVDFDVAALLETLTAHASVVTGAVTHLEPDPDPVRLPLHGRLLAVVGPPGAGSSVVAAALAHGMAERHPDGVLLADLALHADQALLHDTGDIVPGLQDLVEAFRVGRPDDEVVRAHLFPAAASPHQILAGLRRHQDWAALRPRALTDAVEALRRLFATVVVDADGDLEGQDRCGSIEVEERNLLARLAVTEADVVVIPFRPDLRGLRRLALLVEDVVDLSAGRTPILPVANVAPRHPRRRAEIASAVVGLCGDEPMLGPTIHLPYRRQLTQRLRDGAPPPRPLPELLARAVTAVLERRVITAEPRRDPVPVTPGSLGSWTEEATG